MSKKGPKIISNLTIETIADGGVGLARHQGKVIFVEKTIPGDVVDVQIKRKRSDYEQGFVVQFHAKSKLREQPFCNHFGVCGGCTWQNVNYETQLAFKQQLVTDAFRRIGKFTVLPQIEKIIPSNHEKYYRNKLEFTFSNKRWLTEDEITMTDEVINTNALGFHVPGRFDKILNIDHCYLQPAPSNEIRLAARAYALMHHIPFYDLRSHEGFLRSIIVRNTSLHHVMVIVTVAEDTPEITLPFLQHLQQTFPEITSIYYAINKKVNDYLYDLEMIHYYGDQYMVEQIDHIQYRLGPKSFFQTNPEQAKNLYNLAFEFAALKKEDVVYDFYTGLGCIALLAAQHCKKVIGIENVEASISDAKMNAQFNEISNSTFISGDILKIFTEEFIQEHGKADVVITDPPRAGMHKNICLQLLESAPPKIVYISCNPVTQARDIQILSEKYEVVKLQPVDMFPQTYHVENIALLQLKLNI